MCCNLSLQGFLYRGIFCILKAISEHMKEKKVLGNSKYRLIKSKSCQTNLVTIYDEMTLDKRRAVNVAYLSYSGTSLTAFHSIPVS